MTGEQKERHAEHEIDAASRALEEAELLIEKERPEGAISRSYYAIFHAARAVLSVNESNPSTHRGVKGEFGRLLVKTRKVDEEFNAILQEARDQRQLADYESGENEILPSMELARDIYSKASKFVERMKRLVKEI